MYGHGGHVGHVTHITYISGGTNNCVLSSNRITLVGKESYSLPYVIVSIDIKWEKWEFAISAVSLGIFDFFFSIPLKGPSLCDSNIVFLEGIFHQLHEI